MLQRVLVPQLFSDAGPQLQHDMGAKTSACRSSRASRLMALQPFQPYCKICSRDSPPELRLGAVCEGQIGLVEGLHSPNVLPVAIVQVCLYVHAHILGTGDDLTAKVVGLQVAQGPC